MSKALGRHFMVCTKLTPSKTSRFFKGGFSPSKCKKALGEKPWFSTMVSTTFQLYFEVENVTSNYKMFFLTQNDVFNYLLK